jgi:hypothetical protein
MHHPTVVVWSHFTLCAVPCPGLAFSVEERVEALRRAISRGHPVDLEALKALELKSRLVNSSYKYVMLPCIRHKCACAAAHREPVRTKARSSVRDLAVTGPLDWAPHFALRPSVKGVMSFPQHIAASSLLPLFVRVS